MPQDYNAPLGDFEFLGDGFRDMPPDLNGMTEAEIDATPPTVSQAQAALDRAKCDLDWVELCRISGETSVELAALGVNAERRKRQAERVLGIK